MIDAQQLLEDLKRQHPAASEQHLLSSLKGQIRNNPVLAEQIIADWIKAHLDKIDFDTTEETISRERRLLPSD